MFYSGIYCRKLQLLVNGKDSVLDDFCQIFRLFIYPDESSGLKKTTPRFLKKILAYVPKCNIQFGDEKNEKFHDGFQLSYTTNPFPRPLFQVTPESTQNVNLEPWRKLRCCSAEAQGHLFWGLYEFVSFSTYSMLER